MDITVAHYELDVLIEHGNTILETVHTVPGRILSSNSITGENKRAPSAEHVVKCPPCQDTKAENDNVPDITNSSVYPTGSNAGALARVQRRAALAGSLRGSALQAWMTC